MSDVSPLPAAKSGSILLGRNLENFVYAGQTEHTILGFMCNKKTGIFQHKFNMTIWRNSQFLADLLTFFVFFMQCMVV